MQRYSKQRETVLTVLKGTTSHPTAYEVHDAAKAKIPNISLGTVYRNLAGLAESGTILCFEGTDGVEHYDATVQPHPHLYCSRCKRISDLALPFLGEFVDKTEKHTGLPIEGHNIIFYGICAGCLHKH